ncbi:MAG: hypothetical protein HFF17_01910 [Oscillospiraceae bacterium]|nr:hypothetical protein [Oscillospiraceae bacterium]
MDERLEERVTEAVLRKLTAQAPAALCVGAWPAEDLGYRPAGDGPYEAVLIGSLTAGELLCFSQPQVWDALLSGKPVYLWEGGLGYRTAAGTAPRALWARLMAAERSLRQIGVRFYGGPARRPLITAPEARRLLSQQRPLPPGAILTPLARDVLGGRVP